ncbi:Trypsin [Saccharopolyspora antimicrobica]|uniref:Trypsin n=1 Tax=Saccharopolyspora antimicrobica TaxID=455193 RepID=A0A1I5JLS3_9PSEU|nr:serine protease [Saccharopolyspora antimicrobica]RKT84654.1 trypsin [Saccharopolyspora antimicrobica]SFO73331.1 Trypsin [Saccharopolyspora antimicrobica]
MRIRTLLVAAFGAALVGASTAGTAGAVVGGGPADEAYPFMASLQIPGEPRFHCGATLIDEEWLLTAAHCVDSFEAGQLTTRIGSPDRTSGGEERRIAEKIVHPDHRKEFLAQYDFALLKLDRPVDLPTVAIAESAQPPGKDVRAIGWGRECSEFDCGETPVYPRLLKQFDSEVGADSECHKTDGSVDTCVRAIGGASVCSGDSGGPALIRNSVGRWEQIGITSRFGGAEPEQVCGDEPDIFADPVAVRDWIGQQIGS